MKRPVFDLYLDFLRYHMRLIGRRMCRFGGSMVTMYEGKWDTEGMFLRKYSIAEEAK